MSAFWICLSLECTRLPPSILVKTNSTYLSFERHRNDESNNLVQYLYALGLTLTPASVAGAALLLIEKSPVLLGER